MQRAGVTLLFIVPVSVWPQSPSFEVASVKPQPFNGQGFVGMAAKGSTLSAEHVTLYDLVEYAFDLRDIQLSGGPEWANRSGILLKDAQLYQVIAKSTGDTPP